MRETVLINIVKDWLVELQVPTLESNPKPSHPNVDRCSKLGRQTEARAGQQALAPLYQNGFNWELFSF